MTHRAAFLVPPAHHSALCKNVAKSCICHRSAKSACESFICHTSKKAFLQALCLPHLRHPPRSARSRFLLNLERCSRHSQNPRSKHLSVHLGSLDRPKAPAGILWFRHFANHRLPAMSFKLFSADEGFCFPVVSHEQNRLCYTDPVSRKLAS